MDDAVKATRCIEDEHRAISAVLSGMRELARTAMDPKIRPEFPVLNAMLHYIDAFPERLHHPKEEEFLFKPLAAKAPEAVSLVAELRTQHDEGAKLIDSLHRALVEFEVSWPASAQKFRDAVEDYAKFHWDHMRREERELLPLVQRHFDAGEWRRAAAAFSANSDPLSGVSGDDFQKLFTRIVNLAPAPVGLGEPWKKTE